ncbi:MAG: EAL domain-containing protein, partial [Anaeroplasmataceae bacterium]|nr:EAL domain-containing protein [Anaeroplasmataceae bacterium]
MNSIVFLFSIGSFEVTLAILIAAIVILILLVSIIAYRFNHRKQTKASQYMDNECLIFNKKGLERVLKKKAGKFSNPTVMVVEIHNLNYLYMNYSRRSKLMYDISDCLTRGLFNKEIVSRIEFNKFLLVLDERDKEEVKTLCQSIESRLVKMEIVGFGMYDFYLNFGIYENAPLDDPEIIYIASSIIPFTKVIENNLYYYTDDVRAIFEKLKRINNDKQSDFEQNKFVPYIQPNVDLQTGKVVGGEILCRWEDEESGFKFSPSDFIPLFEETGFIRYIDDLMLKSACELVQRMIQRGRSDIIISVNVSKVQFMTPNFENKVMETVQSYQVNPKNIMLEIAENTLMENYEYISKIVMRLRQFGFIVAMDDFGKELSSMESLGTGTFEYVKLDMLFFKNKLASEKDRIVVKNILSMLRNLNYKLISEGVSDERTLMELAQICREVVVQGYVISAPIPLPMFDPFADRVFDFHLPELEEEEEEEKSSKKKGKDKDKDKDGTVDVSVDANLGTPNGGTSINISGLGGTTVVPENNKEMEEMRRQMEEMRRQFQLTIEEQRRIAHEEEVKRLKEQMERMQNQPQPQPQTTTIIKENNDEINALRLEIERLKNQKNPSNTEVDALRLEIERLKLQQQNTNTTTYIQRDYRNRNYYEYDDEISRL